ncbi:hypothetical protein [Actinomyces ruminis]|uniref:hypothetical protein n=1 Tax=Actinomyces ruminis TaxID=1937003 RepID=UPI0015D4E207|nr:hypothetical protein [Actinomyces ruminis]
MRSRHLARLVVSLTALSLAALEPAAAAAPAAGITGSVIGGPVVVAAPIGGMLSASPSVIADDERAAAVAAPAGVDDATVTINLLGISDFGGHIERVSTSSEGAELVSEPGAVALACEVAAARAATPGTLLVSTGDNVGGSAYISSVLDDQPPSTSLTPSVWTSPPPATTSSTVAPPTSPPACWVPSTPPCLPPMSPEMTPCALRATATACGQRRSTA